MRAFEDEHTLPLLILIDVDPSMDRGTAKTELESAVELATLLASQVLLDNERVGLACFSRSDITSYLAPAGGKDQMSCIRAALSSLKAVEGDNCAAVRVPHAAGGGSRPADVPGDGAPSPPSPRSWRRRSGSSRPTCGRTGSSRPWRGHPSRPGTPCSIVVITNLSMGVASLLSGSRIATYYGHNVAVALTPHIWYDSAEDADPEKCYDRYRQAKEMISRLRGRKIAVVELSACEKPETMLYQGRTRGSPGMIRQRR